MDNELEIIYNNKTEKIIKFFSESINRFNERIKFIRILEKEKREKDNLPARNDLIPNHHTGQN